MGNLPDVIDLDKFSYVDFASDNALRGYFTYSSYNSIYVSIIYWEKVEFADSNFDNECENILHQKGSMEYGGEPKNRYCISHVREMRTSTDTFCTPRGEYESFVVFQKERMTILLREVAKSPDVMNKNKAILDIAEALTKSK